MFNSIRVKFSLMFAIMATALIVMAVTYAMQSRATVKQMQEFSQLFNPAISAILNADRDLYQAQLSEEALKRNFPFGIKPHLKSLMPSKVMTLNARNNSTKPNPNKNLKP